MRKVVNIVKQVFKLAPSTKDRQKRSYNPTILTRDQHAVSRMNISSAALKVLYRLHKAGYAAYLVGGSVRDLMLGIIPKDFDVVTDAHPEQIQRLFGNSYIIGRRFRLVHVRFGDEVIEVATFRGHTDNMSGQVKTQHGVILRDNVYGSMDDDVWRRDFTVNALYYNIADFTVVDYANGVEDLNKKEIRVIGDPETRYREDPARMLRAVRLAAKLDFNIEPNSSEPIKKHKELLVHVPPARLFDKMIKIFHSGKSLATFHMLQEYELFTVLFPQIDLSNQAFRLFIEEAFKSTDDRVQQNKPINSAFLFAAILWGSLKVQQRNYVEHESIHEAQAFSLAISNVIQKQIKSIAIPRKLTTIMREIWHLQSLFENPRLRRVYRIFHHPRFRAAYDFLVLRNLAKETDLERTVAWWHDFQQADETTRETMIHERFAQPKAKKRKKKKTSPKKSQLDPKDQEQ